MESPTVYEYITYTSPEQRAADAAAGIFPFIGGLPTSEEQPLSAINCSPCLVAEPILFHRRFGACGILDVSPNAPQAYFRIAPSVKYDGSALTFECTDAYLELRRKGREELLATYTAWRRDANGYVGFYFDELFWNSPPGFYIGDVFINCQYCLSVQLRLPKCEAVVTDCYVQPALETCCAPSCCGVIDMAGDGTIGGGNCGVLPSGPPFYELTNPGPIVPSDCVEVCYPPGPSCVSAGSGTAGS